MASSARPAGGTTRLLADVTMASAVGSPQGGAADAIAVATGRLLGSASGAKPAGGTIRLLADMTMASAVGSLHVGTAGAAASAAATAAPGSLAAVRDEVGWHEKLLCSPVLAAAGVARSGHTV